MKPVCVYCESDNVIKHGKSSNGSPRYRCRRCSKTWVSNQIKAKRPKICEITESYLSGSTFRDLVSIYKSSPLRINQKIREFLNEIPNWEEYLDNISNNNHHPSYIYLMGRHFSCSSEDSQDNSMFVAFAVDGLSSMIVGFEVAPKDNFEVWNKLLGRLSQRIPNVSTLMASGTIHIEEAITKNFPHADFKINFHRVYREKEIHCCLVRLPIKHKLLYDTIRYYKTLSNHNINDYLEKKHKTNLKEFLSDYYNEYLDWINYKCGHKSHSKVEDLMEEFRLRFEKFHMIKDDPQPIINGWVALKMLQSQASVNFSRLAMYLQYPVETSFKDFSVGEAPKDLEFEAENIDLRKFVLDISSRVLQLPVTSKRCELNIDHCEVV